MSTVRIQPELQQALTSETSSSSPLNVFLKLALSHDATTPDERAKQAAGLIRRVQQHVHYAPKFQYRELDGVLHVNAPRSFVSALIQAPEVVAASTAPKFDSAMIEPIGEREVGIDAVDRPFGMPSRTMSRGRRR